MEVMGVSSAASRTALSSGVGGAIGSSKNLASRSQLWAQKKQQQQQRRVVKVEVVAAAEGGVLKSVGKVLLRQRNFVFLGSLAAGLASVEGALALSYDDVVQSAGDVVDSASDSVSSALPSLPDLQLDVDTSGLTDFIADNPLAIVGGLVVLALPVIASNVFKKPQAYGTVSAKQAFEKLGDSEAGTSMLDIRVGDDIRSEGTPDLRSFRKKVTQIPYDDDSDTFVTKVTGKFKDAENTTLYILDRFDGKSIAAAKLLVQNGFKGAYAIKDGAEGPTGWQSSELPWLMPRKGFTLNLGSLKDVFNTDDSSIVPATLGVAAAAGVGLVVFSEAETALQLLGSAALVQIFVKKLLFAKDRKKTLEEMQSFLDTKIAPKEFVGELQVRSITFLTENSVRFYLCAHDEILSKPSMSMVNGPHWRITCPHVFAMRGGSLDQGIGKVFLPQFEEVKAATANGAATVEKSIEKEAPAMVGALSVSEPKQVEAEAAAPAPAPTPAPAPVAAAAVEAPAAPAASTETVSAPIEVPAESTSPSVEAASESKVEEKPAEKELVTAPSTKSTDLPRANRPLSPYTQFPGMKPPPPPSKP
ncbi:hypothetical protein AXG93_115s1530 [Marchantia polymorpha subsp. ruderalis]|uniref:Rhodanese domain-containing protein n=1 Tax=Marchantia polymorpha subsp. ruderalis TaxID=1480154 RepID=A0A176W7L3_MARPO|nr:hypothetical protein AXG93_115s1530 [Marchantia polymorpha subsp. ruderalis]